MRLSEDKGVEKNIYINICQCSHTAFSAYFFQLNVSFVCNVLNLKRVIWKDVCLHTSTYGQRQADNARPLRRHLLQSFLHIITADVMQGRLPLTSLHQHGDLAAFGTLAQQVDHLVVRHALHVSLVHLHDNVSLFQATASWIVNYLLDSLASASGAVCDGETETLLSFLHVNGD